METTIWILACIILCFIAGYQKSVIKKLKLEKAINNNKDTLIELQKHTINYQSETIKNYQSMLSKGVEIKQ